MLRRIMNAVLDMYKGDYSIVKLADHGGITVQALSF